jgi:transposase-like protein
LARFCAHGQFIPTRTGGAMTKRRQRISPEKQDAIIALRLSGVSVRETARRVGVWPSTVQMNYQAYLAEIAEDRSALHDHEREEAIVRVEALAAASWDAWVASKVSGTPDPRFLSEHRQALAQVEKLRGLQVTKTEVSGPDGGPVQVEDAKARLLEKLAVLEVPPE